MDILEKNHIDNIFMNFNTACMSRLCNDEDFSIGLNTRHDKVNSQIILEINYDTDNPFSAQKLQYIQSELECIAYDFELKILDKKSIITHKPEHTMGAKCNINKYISDGKAAIRYYLVLNPRLDYYLN